MRSQPSSHFFNISENDLWSHLKVPENASVGSAGLLRYAIRLGKEGKKAKAYSRLNTWYATQRSDAWVLVMDDASDAELPTSAHIRKTIRLSLRGLYLATPGDEPIQTFEDARLHAGPLVNHLIHTGDKRTISFLSDLLVSCYRGAQNLAGRGGYPLNCMLGAYTQFEFVWRAYLALAHAGPVRPKCVEAVMKLQLGLGRAMQQATERYIVHNIFTAACYGLFFLARSMREFSEASGWESHCLRMFKTDFRRSWFPDGGHAERNWGYGSYTLGRLTHVYQFAMRTGGLGNHQEKFEEALRRAYCFYAKTLGPNDLAPGFGDEGLMKLGHVLDAGVSSGVFPAGTSRDLGVDRSKSYLMEGSGVAIMRNGTSPGSAFANVTFGDFAGWHSHMDLLSMDFRAGKEVLLQEVPRFGPYEHPMDVLWRKEEAHNQLLVDGFHYDSRPVSGQDVAWYSDDHIDYFSAFHTAYRQMPPQEGWRTHHASGDLIVRRTILFVKEPGYCLVLDAVWDEQTGSLNRSTSTWWHSPQKFRVLGPGLVRTQGGSRRTSCLLVWAYPDSLRRIEIGIDYTKEDAGEEWHGHGEWHNLRAKTWMPTGHTGCLGFATVLFPFTGGLPSVSIRPLKLSGHIPYRTQAFEVTTPLGRDLFALNPEHMSDISIHGQPVSGRALVQLGGRKKARRCELQVD